MGDKTHSVTVTVPDGLKRFINNRRQSVSGKLILEGVKLGLEVCFEACKGGGVHNEER